MATQSPRNMRNWSTPLTIGTFLFTGVSGVMLFLHFGEGLIKEAHEWIGLAFVLGALLHVKNHWAPFRRYFSLGLPRAVMATVLAGSVAFMVVSGHEEGGSPVRVAMQSIEKAPLTLVAQLQEREEAELIQLMEQSGFTVTDPGESLKTIAAVNGKSGRELIGLLFQRTSMEASAKTL